MSISELKEPLLGNKQVKIQEESLVTSNTAKWLKQKDPLPLIKEFLKQEEVQYRSFYDNAADSIMDHIEGIEFAVIHKKDSKRGTLRISTPGYYPKKSKREITVEVITEGFFGKKSTVIAKGQEAFSSITKIVRPDLSDRWVYEPPKSIELVERKSAQ